MTVKHEIKSQLAKLLATEDLIVEHKNVDTAQFNVHTRVLILPNWEKASNNVYDMLVGHEVGHALFTPDEWDHIGTIPQQIVNIVEDARIEKLMKRKYPGLAKSFYNGYNELNDKDFFEINDQDLTTLNLADRANLYFKVGSFISLAFSDSEKQIISMIQKCETFEDTKKVALVLYEYCKKEVEDKKQEEAEQGEDDIDLPLSGKKDFDKMTDKELLDELERELDPSLQHTPTESANGSNDSGGIDCIDDVEIKTLQALEDSIKDLTSSKTNNYESVYVELPKLDLKHVVISNKLIHDGITQSFLDQEKEWNEADHTRLLPGIFEESDIQFSKFKKSAQKEVNYLVKEFECRKSASNYARATTNNTGVLDTTKLHTYRYNEDIFKKISVVPYGKNHGLVFILDWSGSMAHVIQDTIKQLYNLLWFCRKVNIPFEVYAFTNEYPRSHDLTPAYEKKEGFALIEATFSLMNLFTSKVRNKELEKQMRDIYRIVSSFSHSFYTPYTIPLGMGLSGTPLNETIVALHQIIPTFKEQHNLQKVQCVILTDGESAPLRYSKEFDRGYNEPYLGSRYINDGVVIRNRKTGHTYSCEGMGYWADVTDLLLKDLRQSFLDVNFIGIRIISPRDAGQFVRRYAGYTEEYENIMKKWRKEKSFSIKNSGYHTYFGIASNALANEDEFEVVEDATKAQIKRAFAKSLKTKKMNKKVLGEFIELVA